MMAMPRESVEESEVFYMANESEAQHRYAHLLLKPNGLYFLFNKEEAAEKIRELPLKFTGEYYTNGKKKKGQFTATFRLVPVKGASPELFMYQLTDLK